MMLLNTLELLHSFALDSLAYYLSTLTSASCSINLSLGAGKLIAIVGSVGAGKSSLLSAILGEMEILDGTISTQVSYLSNGMML